MTSPDGDSAAGPRRAGARREAGEGITARDFHAGFRDTAHYSTGRTWSDYEPVYRYAIATHAVHVGRGFDDVAEHLESGWAAAREESRLAWSEAQGAIRAVWQQLGLHPPAGTGD